MPSSVSLFAGDAIDRTLHKLFDPRKNNVLVLWILAAIIGYLPTLALSRVQVITGVMTTTSFTRDYSAIMQYLVGIPLLLIARRIMDYEWRSVFETINVSRLLSVDKKDSLVEYAEKLARILRSSGVFVVVVVIGYAITIIGIMTVLADGRTGWYSVAATGFFPEKLTLAGWYAWLVPIATFNVLIVYWFVKYVAWFLFLTRFAALDPRVVGFHPDRTGGLHFLSQTTMGFALLIFAVGIVQASTAIYKVDMEGLLFTDLSVVALVLSYVIVAPVIFVAPLFRFSVILYRAKVKGIRDLNVVGSGTITMETRAHLDEEAIDAIEEYAYLGDLSAAYDTVRTMRIWPIDLGSLGRLFFSSVAPMLPIIVQYIDFPEPIRSFLEQLF